MSARTTVRGGADTRPGSPLGDPGAAAPSARGGPAGGGTAGYRRRLRARRGQTLVFAGATALVVLHLLDDAFFHPQPGTGAGDHVSTALGPIAVAVLGVAAYPFLRAGLRSALALVFGVLAVVGGVLHVNHVRAEAASGSDYTGIPLLGVGVVLVGLGVAVPWLARRSGEGPGRRRWRNRAVALVGGALVTYAVVMPVGGAITMTHKWREPVASFSLPHEDVVFAAADGLRLSGWYVPSRNGAAVVVVHGGGGSRNGARAHAELLAERGYGVLLYDSRGRGASEGDPNALGWEWDADVAGALSFLERRPDVESGRIGGLGLSTGGDVLIGVAADDERLAAVVADGATVESLADVRRVDDPVVRATVPFWLTLETAVRVFSGSSPAPPIAESARRAVPTPLLLISAGGLEQKANRLYAQAAAAPTTRLWALPDVPHTAAIHDRRSEYERRVGAFFDEALLGRR